MKASESKGAKRAIRKIKREVRTRKRQPETQAIVLAKPNLPQAQIVSAVPTIQRAVQNMEQVRRFVVKCLNTDLKRRLAKLKPGEQLDKDERERLEIDWGTIPTVDKPFLKQPGAEKFMLWLNLRPKFHTREVELPEGHLEVVCRVVMHAKKTGEEVFEGPDCSCTTMESNYRFRYQERAPDEPKPSKEDAEKLKAKGLGKWRKKAVWAHGKKTGDEWVWLDRVENPNIYDERNKVRQIGEKRAVVKCVRNMGGMSELFISDPGEWEVGDEDFGSPFEDADYTPSGRQIVTQDGTTPSGKPVTHEAQQKAVLDQHLENYKKSEAEQIEKLKAQGAKVKPEPPKGTIEWHWLGEKDMAYVDGDGLPAMLDTIKANTLATWMPTSKRWVVPVGDAEKVKAICKEANYKFVEIQDERVSAATPAPPPAAEKAAVPERAKIPSDPLPSESKVVPAAAFITEVSVAATGSDKLPNRLRVKWGGLVLAAFDKKLFEYLRLAQGKEAELILAGNRASIVGIKRIGNRMFDGDGHTPIINNSEDRPANTASLFQ